MVEAWTLLSVDCEESGVMWPFSRHCNNKYYLTQEAQLCCGQLKQKWSQGSVWSLGIAGSPVAGQTRNVSSFMVICDLAWT